MLTEHSNYVSATIPCSCKLYVQAGTSAVSRAITERPRAPSGLAAFMSAHSKTPYITPGMDFYSGKGVVRGQQGAAAGNCLEYALPASAETPNQGQFLFLFFSHSYGATKFSR